MFFWNFIYGPCYSVSPRWQAVISLWNPTCQSGQTLDPASPVDHRLKSAFVFSNLVSANGNTRLPGYYIETGSSFAVNFLYFWLNFLYFRLKVLDFGLGNAKFGQMAFVSLNSLPPELGWPLCPCSGGLGQFKYQGISRNFRHCSAYLTLAGLPSARCPSRAARPQFSKPPKQVSPDLGLEHPGSSCSLSSLFFNSPVLASQIFLSWCPCQLLMYPVDLLSEHLSGRGHFYTPILRPQQPESRSTRLVLFSKYQSIL